ncbi:MAG: nucleotidyltransferase family protein [Acidobacteria bacterium]|nr:nucleotidyltransferase family protein [Acidobacteriota bacterium]
MNRWHAYQLVCSTVGKLSPGAVRRHFSRRPVAWDKVLEASHCHRLTPLVYWAALDKSLYDQFPPKIQLYLQTAFSLNRRRNQEIVEQVSKLIFQLNKTGAQPILLKGIANLMSGLYQDIGVRMLNDVDLLVSEEYLQSSMRALEQMGYRSYPDWPEVSDRNCYHYPMAHWSQEGLAVVELHREPLSTCWSPLLPAQMVREQAQPLPWDDLKVYLPALEHRMIHNVVHTQLQDANHRLGRVSLRQLYDFVLLAERLDTGAGLAAVDRHFVTHRHSHVFRAYSMMGARLFGAPTDEAMQSPFLRNLIYGQLKGQILFPWLRIVNFCSSYLVGIISGERIPPKNIPRKLTNLARPRFYHLKWKQMWHRLRQPW